MHIIQEIPNTKYGGRIARLERIARIKGFILNYILFSFKCIMKNDHRI